MRDQDTPSRHFLVADGFPNATVANWDCEHISLSNAHADNGNTPRCIGALSAINLGFEVVFFLDADNWYTSDHVSEALRLKAENPEIDIAVLGRHIVLPDGTPVQADPEDENKSHIDTSCYAFFESSFGLLPTWAMMPTFLGPICDRIIFFAVKSRKFKLAWSERKTCYFTSNFRAHYLHANKKPPTKTNDSDTALIAKNYAANKALFKARTGLDFSINYEQKKIP